MAQSSQNTEVIHGLKASETGPNIRILKLKIILAENLAKKDIFGLSDPYCSVKLFGRDRLNDVICTFQTPVRKKTLNPKWNTSFKLRVNTQVHKLLFEIFDENRITRDDFLGETEIPLSQVPDENADPLSITKNYILHRRSLKSHVRGHLRISLAYESRGQDLDVRDGMQAMHIARDIERLAASSSNQVAPQEEGWETVNHSDVGGNRADVRRSSV